MNKTLLAIASMLTICPILSGQNLKTDTISIFNTNIIITHPCKCVIKDFPYEEGVIKTLNYTNGSITILYGAMVKLPIVNFSYKDLKSEFHLMKDVRIYRGDKNGCYFREDDFLRQGISISYENISESENPLFEFILNNIKIENR